MVTMKVESEQEPSSEPKEKRVVLLKGRSYTGVRWLGHLLLISLTISCAAGEIRKPAARNGRSEVQVYIQPVPPEARRLKWTIDDLEAVRSDGSRIPLALHFKKLTGSDLEGRQNHLASGFLPPGSYSGISLTIGEAALIREEGDAALLVPEDPIIVAGSFELASSDVLPLFLNLKPEGLVTGGVNFTPFFTLALPSPELTSLIAYLIIAEADRIVVFNRKSLQITGAIATGKAPRGITIDPVRGRGYIAVSGDNAIQVIDVFQGAIRERISLRTGDKPVDLALTRDGQVLISANYTSNTVSLIDPLQGVEIERIEVGQGPTSVIVNRSGTKAYVTCSFSGILSIIDLTMGTLSRTLYLEENTPLMVALDQEEERLFVISEDSPNLTVVDPDTLTITDKIYVGVGSISMVVDELSGLVFVGRKSSNEISIVDPSVLLPVDTIRLPGAPAHMIIDRQENALLVTIPDKKVLLKINLVNKRVIAQIQVDVSPSEVAVIE